MSRAGGRRVADRPARRGLRMPALRADLIIGVVAVLVSLATFATVVDRAEPESEQAVVAGASPVTEALLLCPEGESVSVAQPVGPEGDGEVTVAVGDGEAEPLALAPGDVVETEVDGSAVIRGSGGRAPGLVAASRADGNVAACVAPAGEWWFAGVGAGGSHTSTLTLSNPDRSAATADLEAWGPDGRVTHESLRSIAVDGRTTIDLDIAELAPGDADVVLRVVVRRGRLGAWMSDETLLATDQVTSAHPATAPPATRAVLPAVPGDGEATLIVGNPGAEAARFEVLVSGAESEAVPLDMEQVPIGAEEVVQLPISANIRKLLADGGASLVVEGSVPLVSSLTGALGTRPVAVAAVQPATSRSAVFLPTTTNRTLVLSAVDHATAATVRFDAGKEWTGRLRPGVATVVPVRKNATFAWVETNRPHQGGVRGQGPARVIWQPLRELREERLVPLVRPDQLQKVSAR